MAIAKIQNKGSHVFCSNFKSICGSLATLREHRKDPHSQSLLNSTCLWDPKSWNPSRSNCGYRPIPLHKIVVNVDHINSPYDGPQIDLKPWNHMWMAKFLSTCAFLEWNLQPLENVCDIHALTTIYLSRSLVSLGATYWVAQHGGIQLRGSNMDRQNVPWLPCFLIQFQCVSRTPLLVAVANLPLKFSTLYQEWMQCYLVE